MKQDTIDLLNAVTKNTEMAKHTANDLAKMAQSLVMRRMLDGQVQAYEDLQNRARAMLAVGGEEPKSQNVMAKMSAKLELKRKTMTDRSERNLAQMMVKGNAMGARNMEKAVKKSPHANVGAIALANRVRSVETQFAQDMKRFL